MDWKIYYANGSTFSSSDGSWDDAPTDGVICVRYKDPSFASRILYGSDFYLCPSGHIIPFQTNDLSEQLRSLRWIKFGLHIVSDVYEQIMKTAINDPDFPKCSTPRRRSTDK